MIDIFPAYESGDEIRSFRNSSDHWSRRAGRRGYALLRDGKVIDAIITAMN